MMRTAPRLEDHSVPQLRDMARKLKVSYRGLRKLQLVDALRRAQKDAVGPEDVVATYSVEKARADPAAWHAWESELKTAHALSHPGEGLLRQQDKERKAYLYTRG